MFQKLILIVSLYFSVQIQSQNIVEDEGTIDNSISAQLYTKCFENLNQGSEFLEKNPKWKEIKLCSLMYCMELLRYEDKEIQQMGEARLIGIATRLYYEETPVILTMGMDSYLEAEKRNQNLDDDDHIVYISYGECINPRYLTQAAEIVNKQTMTLIHQNKSN
ncbi:hypothetical protein C8C83_4612 [Flavobacterium sp. 90]|uniref:hypothetical protein n=1 Tax=unclassified Flavobacterium TaxID=196869 RepID=UPI000EB3A03C|nr:MULTISPECIES: hypothetical protein [unclassified Flavobacterium]RKR05271.1 hypothetical protein C8C82_4954 [Flavobacterium sp. 81]TCK56586.1 hypothetical protein C8C83_4612 [Flavobacterium sp. 90]